MWKGSALCVEHSTRGHLSDSPISQMAFSERLPPFGPVLPYLFSNPANRLDFDPSSPRCLKTFEEYIRKRKMEKGICQASLAAALGVNEMTQL